MIFKYSLWSRKRETTKNVLLTLSRSCVALVWMGWKERGTLFLVKRNKQRAGHMLADSSTAAFHPLRVQPKTVVKLHCLNCRTVLRKILEWYICHHAPPSIISEQPNTVPPSYRCSLFSTGQTAISLNASLWVTYTILYFEINIIFSVWYKSCCCKSLDRPFADMCKNIKIQYIHHSNI